MRLKKACLVLVGIVVALLTCSRAHAWGACHVGYTHVGPNGVYHRGATVARGPYGSYGGVHVAARGAYGGVAYGGGASVGVYHYSAGYHACAYGGFQCAGVHGSVYRAGVYRR